MIPPGLRGPIKVTLPSEVPPTMEEVESQLPDLLPGGRSRPRNCTARHRFVVLRVILEMETFDKNII